MSAIIVTAILIGAIIAICLVFMSIANKQEGKKMNQLLKRFSELGTASNLSFSSQEVFGNSVIGLDGINRKLLILIERDKVFFHSYVLNLDEVKDCTLIRQYGSIEPGDLENRNLEVFLERLALHFEFRNGKDPVEVPFYNRGDSSVYRVNEIEKKADHWKQILEKMLVPDKKIA